MACPGRLLQGEWAAAGGSGSWGSPQVSGLAEGRAGQPFCLNRGIPGTTRGLPLSCLEVLLPSPASSSLGVPPPTTSASK